jgi:hypothetical protein
MDFVLGVTAWLQIITGIAMLEAIVIALAWLRIEEIVRHVRRMERIIDEGEADQERL